MDECILPSIKNLLPVDESDEFWDSHLVTYINGEIAAMHSEWNVPEFVLGLTGTEKWTDWISDEKSLALVKPYLKFSVQKQFDPPTVGAMEDSMNDCIDRYGFFIQDKFNYPEATT